MGTATAVVVVVSLLTAFVLGIMLSEGWRHVGCSGSGCFLEQEKNFINDCNYSAESRRTITLYNIWQIYKRMTQNTQNTMHQRGINR